MPWQQISISKLEINNFKKFYGHHEIELSSQSVENKPIVLIGGDNGRGKTSIHEAINYALYEEYDLPGIQNRPNYLQAVTERLNRTALDDGLMEYFVALELDVSEGGVNRKYLIKRSWDVDIQKRKAIKPILSIYENGKQVESIEDKSIPYQDFIRRILPPRIAPFFFFDGERIQEFADDKLHERSLIEAIEDILHISVYKRMQLDIKIHVIDHIEKNDVKKSETEDFFKLQEEHERITNDLEDKRGELDDVKRYINELQLKSKGYEVELRRIANTNTFDRDNLTVDRERITQELEAARYQLRQSFEVLPVLVSGNLVKELYNTLECESKRMTTESGTKELKGKLEVLKERVFRSNPKLLPQIQLTPTQLEHLKTEFDIQVEEIFDLDLMGEKKFIHDIGDAERNKVLNRLQSIITQGDNLREALSRKDRLEDEYRENQLKLQSASGDPKISELIEQNKKVNKELGQSEQREKELIGIIQRLESDLATRAKQIEDRQLMRDANTKAKKVIKEARRSLNILDEFIKRLAPEKLKLLSRLMSDN